MILLLNNLLNIMAIFHEKLLNYLNNLYSQNGEEFKNCKEHIIFEAKFF